LDGQFDGTIRQSLFCANVALLPRFGAGPFHGVDLEEAIKISPIAPPSPKIVEVELASGQIGDNGVLPIRELDSQTGDFAAEKPCGTLDGRGQTQSLTGGPDSRRVANFRFYGYDV
jgi:hypothetical protein